jgi:hypothetical protein
VGLKTIRGGVKNHQGVGLKTITQNKCTNKEERKEERKEEDVSPSQKIEPSFEKQEFTRIKKKTG